MITYSFIIPHRNDIKSLRRCIDSIPIREDVEVIVIDDCSNSDNLPSVYRPNMITEYLKYPQGAGNARNIGIEKAKGEWLFFADCDDFYESGFLNIIDGFNKECLDIVFFDVHYRYNMEDCSEQYFMTDTYERWLSGDHSHRSEVNVKHGYNVPWNKLIRRGFVESIHARYEAIPVGNDAWFTHYCACNTSKIDIIPAKLYYYVDNSLGLTRKNHPYESIEKLFESTVKVNRLKAQSGAWSQIMLPFFDYSKYVRMFGFIKATKLYYKKNKNDINPIVLIYHKIIDKL